MYDNYHIKVLNIVDWQYQVKFNTVTQMMTA